MPAVLPLLGAAAAGGLGVTAYAVAETRRFVLREATVPLLPRGHAPLKVLHLSDLHLTPGQRRKQDWVRELASLQPDLVVDTGDHLAHRDSVPFVLDSLGSLLDVPGVFVFGSNDYFSPTLRNPLRYLLPDDGKRHIGSEKLPFDDLRAGLTDAGWLDLTNRHGSLTVAGRRLRVRGRRRPAPGLRPARRGGRTGRPGRRRPARGRARAVPPRARPVRGRRVRRGAGRAHARRPGLPAGRACADHQLRPRAGPGQGLAPPSGGVAHPAIRARPGCTSRPVWGPRRTRRSASRAAPRRPC